MNSAATTQAIRSTVRDSLAGVPRVVLAVSGGVDSMVLFDAAAAWIARARLIVATFDHGTGAAAMRAVRMVRARAEQLGVECVSECSSDSLTSEAEYRAARWSFLRNVAARFNPTAPIATAHTEDDQIETVLLRIMRGSGARGVAGLYARSDVLRPLVAFRRSQVEAYAAQQGLRWVEDPSNATLVFARNRIRHEILPALLRVSPQLDQELLALARTAARCRDEVDEYVDRSVGLRLRGKSAVDVNADALRTHSTSELALIWPAIAARVGSSLDRRGIARLSEFTARARVGSRIPLSGDWRVIRSRTAFQLRASSEESEPGTIAVTGSQWGEWSFRPVLPSDSAAASKGVWSAWLPLDQPVIVRCWQPGDKLRRGEDDRPRSVKRLLSRSGVTGDDRTRWPVVLAGGEIVWIPGVGRSDAATARSGRPGLPFVCDHNPV